ncbi:MAG: hypothetical protein JNL67_11765 [Planctomycetaceae bacterium]|nr:hypothetical protein [Planctomycetaceae bacterium]
MFTSDDRLHPEVKESSSHPAYWYNVNSGVARARVPTGTQQQIVDAYNRYNGTNVTSVKQESD